MSTYIVRSASIRRNSGILGVELEVLDPKLGCILEVVGQPGKRVTFRVGRPVFDDADGVLSKSIMIIEPPDFPIQELVGQRLADVDEA
jgi:hypothetical protein